MEPEQAMANALRTAPAALIARLKEEGVEAEEAPVPGGLLLRGAGEVAALTDIPVLCHVAEERFAPNLSDLREPVFPITIKMKKPWEL